MIKKYRTEYIAEEKQSEEFRKGSGRQRHREGNKKI